MTFRFGNFDALLKKNEGITEEIVDTKIAEAISSAEAKYDDTKIFANRGAFPEPGTVDVLYVAQDTGVQYIWTRNPDGTSDYEPIQEAMSEADIKNIVV